MIVKEAKYKICSKCKSRKLIKDEEHGCDWCKKIINYNKNESSLNITVFHEGNTTEHLHLCSWKCVYTILPTLKCNYFIDLPHLLFKGVKSGSSAAAFFKVFYQLDKFDNIKSSEVKCQKENKRLKDAIRWALGYTNFPLRNKGEGAYWWRKELGKRAGM